MFNPLMLGGAMGGIGGILGAFMGRNNKNPADAAMPYIGRMGSDASKYLNPYMQSANGMSGGMNDLYQQLMKNPSGFLASIGQGYQKSPGYDFAMQEALKGSSNAEAAGGMLGTPEHSQRNQEVAEGLASKDYQQYLQNALGVLGMGIQGGENTLGRGLDASKNMTNTNNQMLSDMASYSFGGQAGKNQASNQKWSNIFGGTASVMPWLFN